MRDGVLQQLGTPNEVYNRPANAFVATFIGSPPMNLVPGSVERAGDGWRFRADGVNLRLDPAKLGVADEVLERTGADEARLGIRPEDLRLGPAGSEGIPGRVQLLEPVGSDLFLTIEAFGTLLQVRTAPDTEVAIGDNVSLSFAPGKSHIFAFDGQNVRVAANGTAPGAAAS
jgi:multiple sugar transport system ATP-binding protein